MTMSASVASCPLVSSGETISYARQSGNRSP